MANFNDNQRDRDRARRDKPSRFSDANPRERSRDRPGRENTVFVSNIPYEYKWTDVKLLFRRHVGDVAFVELFNDENDKPRGCGIVEFSSPEYVKKAMEVMHRFPLEGRKLVIKEDYGTVRTKHGHPVDHERDDSGMRNNNRNNNNDNWINNSGGGGGGNNGGGNMQQGGEERFNTYGLSLQFLDSINVRGPLLNRIFVANLDYKVDKKKLKEVFKMAGKVRNIDLSVDKDGNSRGFAVIEYDHPVEAVQAISMFDKQLLFERKLAVRMDRANSGQSEMRLPDGLQAIGPGLGPSGEPLRDVVSSLPQQQSATQSATGAGLLGAVPALGGLGLQALGQLGLGQLQSQLLQQGLSAGDLSSLGNTGGLSSNLQELGNNSMQAPQMQNNNFSNNGFQGLNNSAFGRGINVVPAGMNTNLNSSMNSGMNPGMGFPHQPPGGRGESPNFRGMSPGGYGDNRGGARDMDTRGGNNPDKPGDMVLIKYLPATVTWQLLREKFSEAGEVKFAEKIDSETAVVRFQSEWGSTRAIKMFDKTRIDGKTIVVRHC